MRSLGFLTAFLVAVSPAVAHGHAEGAFASQQSDDIRVLRLSDHVLVIQDTLTLSNLTAVSLGGRLLLVDNFLHRTSMRSALRALAAAFPGIPISHAVNTHGHDDQTWGNELLAADVVTFGHVNTIRYMRERVGQMAEFVRRAPMLAAAAEDSTRLSLADTIRNRLSVRAARIRANLAAHGDVRVTPPSVGVAHDTMLRVGDADVRIFVFGPAHTDGDIAVHVPSRRLLVVGDIAQPNTVLGIDPAVGTARDWIEALDRLIAVARRYAVQHVVGGNRDVGDRRTLEDTRGYFARLLAAVDDARRLGPTLEQTITHARLPEYAQWNNYAEVHTANIRAVWNRR